MSPNATDEVAVTLSALLHSPEGAAAVAHALVAELIRQKNEASDPDANHRALVPLLKEYTRKLQEFASGIPISAGTRPNPQSQQLLVAARRLSQFVSQRLNRVTDEVLRMELEMRLAEYEAALGAAALRG